MPVGSVGASGSLPVVPFGDRAMVATFVVERAEFQSLSGRP